MILQRRGQRLAKYGPGYEDSLSRRRALFLFCQRSMLRSGGYVLYDHDASVLDICTAMPAAMVSTRTPGPHVPHQSRYW